MLQKGSTHLKVQYLPLGKRTKFLRGKRKMKNNDNSSINKNSINNEGISNSSINSDRDNNDVDSNTDNNNEHNHMCSPDIILKSDCCHTGENISDTDFGYTLSLINGKYKLIIIYWLANHKSVMRYNELKRCLGNISHKTLSSTLKEMEKDALIIRNEYPQIPPKVEYSLSERGKSLIPILVSMCHCGGENKNDIIR